MVDIVDLGSASESDDSAESSSSYGIIPDDINHTLDKLLCNINSLGSFACSLDLRRAFIDPKITVEGVGPIQLPLSPETARAIAQTCHQAPFGRGEETVVDASVRNTWELNPEKFSITEPKWSEQLLPRILLAVRDELGVFGSIRGQLYKMLLYEKGAMFKAHRDTEKTPGMFGTLVICLPSPHEGGDVHTTHAKNTKILRSSDCMPSCIAWYSDVEHEVKEVVSGYRWVLTYNLIADGPPGSVSAATTSKDRAALRNNLKVWKTEYTMNPSYRSRIVHLLDHQYTDASLDFSSLKSRDRKIATMFQGACDALGLEMFLASFERMREGQAEPNTSDDDDEYDEYDEEDDEAWGAPEREKRTHFIDSEYDSSVTLTRVIDRLGTEVATDVDIDINDIIQEDTFEDNGPDEEEYEGFTGNAGCTATHWYRRTALVIVPREHVAKFLLSQLKGSTSILYPRQELSVDQKLREIIKHLEERQQRKPWETHRRDSLVEVCQYALEQQKKKVNANDQSKNGRYDELLGAVVSAAGWLKDVALFNQATVLVRTKLPPDDLVPISRWLWTDGFQMLRKGLEQALPRAPVVSCWYEYFCALDGFRMDETEAEEPNDDPEFEAWRGEKLTEILQNAPRLWLEDGFSLGWIWNREQGTSDRHARMLQLLQKYSHNTPALVRFLLAFRGPGYSESNKVDFGTYKTVLDLMLHWFSLSMDPRTIRLDAAYLKEGERLPAVEGNVLAELLIYLGDVSFHDELGTLTQKIGTETSRMNVVDLDFMFLPLLVGLARPRSHTPADVMSQPFRSLFQTTIKQYLLRYVGKVPAREPDWTTPAVKCPCGDCQALNDFLCDPNERVWRFRGTKKARYHIHQKLNHTTCDHRTNHQREPNTMVVTKMQHKNAQRMERWTKRAATFDEKMRELGNIVNLPQLLGDEYSIVMSKTYAAAPTGPVSRAPVAGPSGTRPPLGPPPVKDASSIAHSTQPLVSKSGNAQRAPATPGPSSARKPTSTSLKNTPGSREAVKRKAAEMESVDLTPLKNTAEMRREVKQKTMDVEVLDLTAD